MAKLTVPVDATRISTLELSQGDDGLLQEKRDLISAIGDVCRVPSEQMANMGSTLDENTSVLLVSSINEDKQYVLDTIK